MKSKVYLSKTASVSSVHAYYDLSPKKRHYIGTYSSISEAVHARNVFEISLLASGNLRNTLKALAKHYEITLWRQSYGSCN